MLFERVEDTGLSQYSYVIGCPESGRMAVVDPRRDVDVYERLAHRLGLRISDVLETHIHADFASGGRELAARTGADHWLSVYDEGETFDVAFPHRELADGDEVAFGEVRIVARHTPGHTPEHLAFLVYELSRSTTVPALFLTGDFLFVGSLGRPDLLGEEEKLLLARRMYASVNTVLPTLPDGLEVHPGHGAGSMCGAGMSGRAMSTLGFERFANPYLLPQSEDDFVAALLGNVPPFPPYYRRMKRVNSEGPALLGGLPGQAELEPAQVRDAIAAGEVVVDVRSPDAFCAGHIPDALSLGAGNHLSQWAAWVVPYDTPLILVGDHPAQLDNGRRGLIRVGLDDARGALHGGMDAWRAAGFPVATVASVTPEQLTSRLEAGAAVTLVDVRTDAEYRGGHVPGSRNIMGGVLEDHLAELPTDQLVAIVCRSGYRSTVAASVLQRRGRDNVMNVRGGMNAWRAAGLPVEA